MKKYEFWLCGMENLIVWPLCFISCIGIIIFGIVINNEASIYPILFGSFFIVYSICVILINQKILSKLILTSKGISLKRFDKILVNIDWNEVNNIDEICIAKGSKIITIQSSTSKINISPTKKIYNALIDICPYQSFKNIINNLEVCKWYQRHNKTGD